MYKTFILLFAFILLFKSSFAQNFNWISCIGYEDQSISEINSNVIFQKSGNEIYKSNGTLAGTNQIYSFPQNNSIIRNNNGFSFDNDTYFVKMGNFLFFKVISQNGSFLWKTDGNINGTLLTKDLSTNVFCSNLCLMNSKMYFLTSYKDPIWGNITNELWQSDGTTNGTITIKNWTNEPSIYQYNNNIRYFNNKIYFSGFESDGTTSGTIKTGVILPKESESCLYNGYIYYNNNNNIWRTNGTKIGTSKTMDFPINGKIHLFNGWMYFSGGESGPGKPGFELYKTDGTLSNTSIVKDIYLGYKNSYPSNFIHSNNLLYFIADDGFNGRQYWKTDGTFNGTNLVKQIAPTDNGLVLNTSGFNDSDYDRDFKQIIFNNELYFYLKSNNGLKGIWKTDGTLSNTVFIHQTDSIRLIQNINSKIFFVADSNNTCQRSIWTMDNNTSNFEEVKFNLEINNTIFPNPNNGKFKVNIPLENLNNEFEIFDEMGRKIKTIESNNDIDISDFENGIYYLNIKEENIILKILVLKN